MRRPTINGISSGEQQSNRLFIILAVALIGLICFGLLGLGGIFIVSRQNRQAQQAAIELPPPTLPPPTFTPTSTNTPTPTDTPLPTPTSTLVVNPEGQQASNGGQELPTATPDLLATPTNTLVLQPTSTGTPVVGEAAPTATPAEMPQGGGVLPAAGNRFLIWIGAVLLLLLTFGAFNHLRPPSSS